MQLYNNQLYRISDCLDEYHSFRDCIVREKKIFRSMVDEQTRNSDPNAITDYLEKHFKEKEKLKKQRQMMGTDEQELRNKIQKMEEDHLVKKKKIDTLEFQNKRQIDNNEERYI